MSDTRIPKDVPIRVEIVIGDGVAVLVWAHLTPPGATCPRCGPVSQRVRSTDGRSVQDLPWRSVPVRWQLRCRKFWCDTLSCTQRVLPGTWLRPHQQRTEAVWTTTTQWSWAASAADVARVATQQGLPVSTDTVLRLRAHPTIRLVTRDRDERFARAIAAGTPTAQQVTGRFHLLQNLWPVLERVFARHGVGPVRSAAAPVESASPSSRAPTVAAQRGQDPWTRIQEPVAAGYSLRAIARPLN